MAIARLIAFRRLFASAALPRIESHANKKLFAAGRFDDTFKRALKRELRGFLQFKSAFSLIIVYLINYFNTIILLLVFLFFTQVRRLLTNNKMNSTRTKSLAFSRGSSVFRIRSHISRSLAFTSCYFFGSCIFFIFSFFFFGVGSVFGFYADFCAFLSATFFRIICSIFRGIRN